MNELIDSSIEIEKNKRIPTSVLECFISKIIVCPDHLEWHLRTGTEITKEDEKNEPIKLAEFKINRDFAIHFLTQKFLYFLNNSIVYLIVGQVYQMKQ